MLELLNMVQLTCDRVVYVSTALIVYFTKICWFGLCDEENVVATSFPSFVFVFAFALLFSEYDWFPRKIRYRSEIAVFVFKISAIMLATDLLLKLVWEPFVVASQNFLKTVSESITKINSSLYLESDSILGCLAELIEEDFTHSLFLTVIAFVCLYWILNGLGFIKLIIEKIQSKRHTAPTFECNEETFQEPTQLSHECKPKRGRRPTRMK